MKSKNSSSFHLQNNEIITEIAFDNNNDNNKIKNIIQLSTAELNNLQKLVFFLKTFESVLLYSYFSLILQFDINFYNRFVTAYQGNLKKKLDTRVKVKTGSAIRKPHQGTLEK